MCSPIFLFSQDFIDNSHFSQDFVDNSHFGLEIHGLLNKNSKSLLRKAIVSNWYQNLNYNLIRKCVRLKTLGSLKKYVHSNFLTFDLLRPCSSLFTLHVFFSLPFNICFLYWVTKPSLKKFKEAFEVLNEKSESQNNFFCKLNMKYLRVFYKSF